LRGQLLDAARPPDLLTVVDRLTLLQLDPTAAIAPSADLVAWSRLGDKYRPADLKQALEHDRTLFEHRSQDIDTEPPLAMVRPMAQLGLYLADMEDWAFGRGRQGRWLDDNAEFRKRVLEQLGTSGPLQSRDIPDTAAIPWESTGWTHDRNVTQMLECLAAVGEVAVAGRRGRQRLWDLASRVYPADVKTVPPDEARRRRNERRLRALGIARPQMVGEAGVDAQVEGTAGLWRVDPKATADGFEGRAALLSPFDRLIHDRKRTLELFEFDYTLEMYKPESQRRWGYFALPVLHGDRLVGKLDATVDRKARTFTINAVHHDVTLTRAMTAAVDVEIDALRAWLDLDAPRRQVPRRTKPR
jgi:uncharacterized protein